MMYADAQKRLGLMALECANHTHHRRWAGLPNRDVYHAGSNQTENTREIPIFWFSGSQLGEVHGCQGFVDH